MRPFGLTPTASRVALVVTGGVRGCPAGTAGHPAAERRVSVGQPC